MTQRKFSERKSKRIIQNIIQHEKGTLRYEVALESIDCDSLADFFNDVIQHGCSSGMISSLVYYSQTKEFFISHYDEIEELREEFEADYGCPIKIKGDLMNFLSWFAFEQTAYSMYEEVLGVPF